MDGAFERLYRSMGRSYAVLLFLSAAFLALVFPIITVYVATSRYLGMASSDVWHVTWIAVVGVEVGTLIATMAIVARTWAVIRWIGGRRGADAAGRAWSAAVGMPRQHLLLAPVPITLGSLPAVIAINDLARPAWYSVAAITLGVVVVVALGIVLHQVMCEAILRPVIAEIVATSPVAGTQSVAGRSLRRRIIVSSLLVVWSSAWLATGLVARTTDPIEQLTLTIVAGLGIAITFGLVLTLALSQSLFGPLRDLVHATRRVRDGDLTTRVGVFNRDEVSELAESFNEMVGGLAEREALRSALGAYVDPGIADRLLAEGQILQGEDVEVTIMFVDIVGFSARAEMRPAEQVCAELNEFFGLIVPIVEEHGGHTNKLIGDGLMAVFGTPVKLDDHADRALRAACAVQEQLHDRYRGTLRAGVGVHTGPVVVGTMGGGSKLDFTLIGDAVNVAARVEALTRQTGDAILITEATKDALRRPDAALSSRGTEVVRGRTEPVALYAVASRVPA